MTAACPTESPPAARPVVSPAAAAAGLILASSALHLVYLLAFCSHDLAPDEAHYWDWSRQLDWAYYSKGPLVAWLIRAGCTLFGDTPFGVRFPASVCSALLLAGVYRLAGSPRLGLLCVAVGLTLPPVAAGAMLMTIDAPLLACWAWAAVAVRGGRWAAAGVLCGVGVLAKPTMLVFPLCVGLWLLAAGRGRELGGRRFLTLVALAAAGLVPIVGWNAAHGWPSVAHLLALGGVGAAKPAGLNPLGPLEFVGTQAAVLLGFWLVAWLAAVRRPDPRTALLWWLSVPVWGLFALASLAVKPQANWPVVAYVTGLPLAVGWATRPARRPWVGRGLAAALVVGVVISLAAHFPQVVRPVLAAVAPAGRPAPVRRLDPTTRLAGWRTLAEAVDRVREQVRAETGEEPLVAGMSWTLPGELGFYCDGHPRVSCFGPAVAERHSQYDVWRPNPAADAQVFRGRAFVYVGELNPAILQAFDRCGPPVEVIASDGGIPVNRWTVRACYGFRGFAADTEKGRGF